MQWIVRVPQSQPSSREILDKESQQFLDINITPLYLHYCAIAGTFSTSIFLSLQHLSARIQLSDDLHILYWYLIFYLENLVGEIPICLRSMFDILWSQRDVSHLSWFRITPPLFHWFGFSLTLIKSFIIPLWGWKPRWHTLRGDMLQTHVKWHFG